MAVHNLYFYHCITSMFKLLKFRCPYALYELLSLSNRKTAFIITPSPTVNFFYQASTLWNQSLSKNEVTDLIAHRLGSLKNSTRKQIFSTQKEGEDIIWSTCNFLNKNQNQAW